MIGPDELAQFLAVFSEETAEILGRMEQAAVALERGDQSVEQLQSLFRGAHTLKGNAASLGLQALTSMSHALEDVLDRLRSGEASPTPALVTLLLAAIDALKDMAANPEGSARDLGPSHRRLQGKLRRWLRGPKPRGDGAGPAAPPSVDGDAPSVVAGAQGRGESQTRAATRTLRVDVEALDVLMNLAGEIATARSHIASACDRLGPAGAEVLELVRDSDRLHEDLHDAIVRARLVPLGPTFRQQARTVRDAATRGDKQAQLVLAGEDVMVDTSVIEAIREPLVHLVRNAVDHGIESPEARVRAGKPPAGTIALRAIRRGGSIVIELSDDGMGLDREAILARAKASGLVASDAEMTPETIDRLIFMPGFTTTDSVTELSGRGVGLDVVRRRVEAVRGSVHIESSPGEGSTVTLRLPLTIAIIDAYRVVAGGRHYVIPADSILECRAWTAMDRLDSDRSLVERDGHALACIRLSSVLGSPSPPPPREELVVVDCEGATAGLVVDAILGSGPTVVKPLGSTLKGLPAVAGFTILGDGEVAPILDLVGVLGKHRGNALESAP